MTSISPARSLPTAEAVLARVRARARLLAAWTEKLWSDGQTSADQGLAITPGEVRRILSAPEALSERYRHFLGEHEPKHLVAFVQQGDEALASDPFWNGLVDTFGLNPRERDLLCLLVAVELDPKLGRVLAYIADDTRAARPTAAVAAAMFQPDGPLADPRPDPMATLVRWRLAQPVAGETAWQSGTPWQVDEAVVLSTLAEHWVDPALDRIARMTAPEEAKKQPCLYPEVLAEMLAQPLEGADGDRLDIALVGPSGSGRRTLASQYAAALGRPLIAVRTPSLTTLDSLIRAVRFAHVTRAVIYWRDSESVGAADWSEVRSLADVSVRGAVRPPASATHRFQLKPLPLARRLEAWAQYSDGPPPPLVRIQRLTPAEVKLAAKSGPGAAIEAALRPLESVQGELLQALPLPYTWDDFVAPAGLRRVLEAFESQVRLRWEVYEEWGFSRLTHLGQGISALFGGPSGTGKTMAAQVLARSLGLALYRVDLAGVVNKYIGETEKRLRDVFDACERSGALLFFDEADALFGSRMQVKDSHDRFANIEIDYLLQRIEQFDGIAILATNRKNDLDAAFLRRLRFVIDFLSPGKEERLALWRKSLPPTAPDGEQIVDELDFKMLADEMELTGAQIKAIALAAAFLARSDGARIGIKHIEVAAQREYAKQGLLLRAPFEKAVLR